MELRINLEGAAADERTTLDLQDWLRRERLQGARIGRPPAEATPETMGLDPATILSVVLGAEAVVELVKSIHVWLKTRKPKLHVVLKTADGEVTIDGENISDEQSFLTHALSGLKLQS